MARPKPSGPVRYAVVGLGHIAQAAVLPAFAHAKNNSRLVAIVSGDRTKRTTLSRKYRVDAFTYGEYQKCLTGVDAVYIALPNSMHAEYTIRAARAGVHVLCEKPMAPTVQECEQMIEACRDSNVRLMIAYRLHFEHLNLEVADLVRRRRIGEAEVLQFVVRPASGRRERPHPPRHGRWIAVRHRRLLHQRRAQPVRSRAERSDGDFREQRRPAPSRDRRIDWRPTALRRGAPRRVRHQLQLRRCSRVSDRGDERAASRRSGVPSTRKDCSTR